MLDVKQLTVRTKHVLLTVLKFYSQIFLIAEQYTEKQNCDVLPNNMIMNIVQLDLYSQSDWLIRGLSKAILATWKSSLDLKWWPLKSHFL